MKTGRVLLLGCGAVLGVALLAGLALAGFFYYVSQDPAGMQVRVEAPESVAVGEIVELRVTVENHRANQPLTVSSIDLGESYLDGFTLVSVKPATKSSSRIPLAGDQTHEFNLAIRPGATNVFTFRLRARAAGAFGGDVDVCEGWRFLTQLAETEVTDPDAAEAPPPSAPR